MRYIAMLPLLIALESLCMAYDLPVVPTAPGTKLVEPAAAPSAPSQTGTVVGGGLLAAALIVGGLWLNQKRKSSKPS